MSCQVAASKRWNTFHMDLKTVFLQGQSYSMNRDAVCQLPGESHPPCIAARLEKPAYSMNDVPRRWWNMLDKALCGYGMVPTRADRRCCVLYSTQTRDSTHWNNTSNISNESRARSEGDATFEKMLDPIEGSPATGRSVAGILNLFVDDLFGTGGTEMGQRVLARLGKDSQSWFRRLECCALHRTKNVLDEGYPQSKPSIEDSQEKAIEELEEIPVEKNTKEYLQRTRAMHARCRSLLGQCKVGHSFNVATSFSRCASKAASPPNGDVTISINVEQLHHQIRLRILSCSRMTENHREPKVSEEKVSVVECIDGLARIT